MQGLGSSEEEAAEGRSLWVGSLRGTKVGCQVSMVPLKEEEGEDMERDESALECIFSLSFLCIYFLCLPFVPSFCLPSLR